jgi:histone acetyltransferase
LDEDATFGRAQWDNGSLKDYNDATLMHCALVAHVDYLELTSHLHLQRQMFLEQLRRLTNQHVIYPGIEAFKKPNPPPFLTLDQIPGLAEATGWKYQIDLVYGVS